MEISTVKTSETRIKVIKKGFIPESDVINCKRELDDLKRRFIGLLILAEERITKWETILLKDKT